MSTGLQDGIAVPHARTEGIDDLYLAVGLKPRGWILPP
jgi:mannitol/fructose-specific phosphotransferase system IIA component (Ntr-type)